MYGVVFRRTRIIIKRSETNMFTRKMYYVLQICDVRTMRCQHALAHVIRVT